MYMIFFDHHRKIQNDSIIQKLIHLAIHIKNFIKCFNTHIFDRDFMVFTIE